MTFPFFLSVQPQQIYAHAKKKFYVLSLIIKICYICYIFSRLVPVRRGLFFDFIGLACLFLYLLVFFVGSFGKNISSCLIKRFLVYIFFFFIYLFILSPVGWSRSVAVFFSI